MVAYSLCYRRHFLRLTESLEILPHPKIHFKLRMPWFLERLLFRSQFEYACSSFVFKVLFRSERHLMFFGGYLGIGLVLIAQTAVDSAAKAGRSPVPNMDVLLIPLMIVFFLLTGLRFAFDVPAMLTANWVFRVMLEEPKPSPASFTRRLMLSVVIPWELLLVAPITANYYGWRIAIMHTASLVVLTVLFVEGMVLKCRKIPFTCSVQPEIRQLLVRILGTVFAVITGIPILGALEHWMLVQPPRFVVGAALAAGVWAYLRYCRREWISADGTLTFEDRPASSFELLRLV
jgi:hypothetical protein